MYATIPHDEFETIPLNERNPPPPNKDRIANLRKREKSTRLRIKRVLLSLFMFTFLGGTVCAVFWNLTLKKSCRVTTTTTTITTTTTPPPDNEMAKKIIQRYNGSSELTKNTIQRYNNSAPLREWRNLLDTLVKQTKDLEPSRYFFKYSEFIDRLSNLKAPVESRDKITTIQTFIQKALPMVYIQYNIVTLFNVYTNLKCAHKFPMLFVTNRTDSPLEKTKIDDVINTAFNLQTNLLPLLNIDFNDVNNINISKVLLPLEEEPFIKNAAIKYWYYYFLAVIKQPEGEHVCSYETSTQPPHYVIRTNRDCTLEDLKVLQKSNVTSNKKFLVFDISSLNQFLYGGLHSASPNGGLHSASPLMSFLFEDEDEPLKEISKFILFTVDYYCMHYIFPLFKLHFFLFSSDYLSTIDSIHTRFNHIKKSDNLTDVISLMYTTVNEIQFSKPSSQLLDGTELCLGFSSKLAKAI